jgi:hypothetical protein
MFKCYTDARNFVPKTTMQKLARLLSIVMSFLLVSQSPIADGSEDDYAASVKGVLSARCYACHGALKQESDLRLDTVSKLLAGGASGAIVVPGQAGESEILRRVSSTDDAERMPPEGKPLTADEILALTRWINDGANGPADEKPEVDPAQHWAFLPPVRSPIAAGPIKHPIDAILDEQRRREKLSPVGPADRGLLLRRLYLDVIGIPPTQAELKAFLADDSELAWDKAVDHVLNQPQYGERWGRHWMDVWRYSDWYGLGAQLRNSQKHIWRWRDWIIESLNEDKGYDQMVLEMLAGDEIAPESPETLRATGYLARNYYLFNRTTWLDSTIEHTSQAFMGLTINCAKCHDHKYDPITHEDYYRLRAIFEPHQVRLDTVPGQMDLDKDGLPRAFDAHPEVSTFLHIRGDEKQPDKEHPILPGPPMVFPQEAFRIEPVPLPVEAHSPQLRDFVLQTHLAASTQRIQAIEAQLVKLAAQQKQQKPTGDSRGKRFIDDNFIAFDAETWHQGEDEWSYVDGLLRQLKTGATRREFLSLEDHPTDFVAGLRFRILGGEKWMSIGINFDMDGPEDKTVYMSAVQGGSKLQVSYTNNGVGTYPTDGAVAMPVVKEQWYELRVAARGPLVNVWIDGEQKLAYRLTVPRKPGKIGFMAFDAHAEFDSFSVHQLADGYPLAEPNGTPLLSPAALALEIDHQQKLLVAERLRGPMLSASVAAFRSQRLVHDQKLSDEGAMQVQVAAVASRRFEAAIADAKISELHAKLKQAKDDNTHEATQKEVEQAIKQHVAALTAIANPGDKFFRVTASRKGLEGPAESADSRTALYPTVSTGRRTALAKWLVDRQNPLAARVAVNHIWLRHFAQPIVDPVTDFGRRAPVPTQQRLLDWLAVELMENGWSMKHLHRLILTSQAYRMSTSAAGMEDQLERDGNNAYYWRRTAPRMESEVLRDSVLHLAQKLDLTQGGPSLPTNDANNRRRSLYFLHSRDSQDAFLLMFDDADILRCYRRQESVVPQQALAMANSRLTLEFSQQIAAQVQASLTLGDNSMTAYVDECFRLILCRPPTKDEQQHCLDTIDQIKGISADQAVGETRARVSLVHVLLNHNDFITIR